MKQNGHFRVSSPVSGNLGNHPAKSFNLATKQDRAVGIADLMKKGLRRFPEFNANSRLLESQT